MGPVWIFGIAAAVALVAYCFFLKRQKGLDCVEVGKADLRALLGEVNSLLIVKGSIAGQLARDLHAMMLLDYFLKQNPRTEKSQKIIRGVKGELELYFGRPVDPTVRFTWRESIRLAKHLL